jgi:hypothetical protein
MSEGPKRRWFQFALKDLFFAITFLAVGFGGLVYCMRGDWSLADAPLVYGMWYGSVALIGAGVTAPFDKKTLGAVFGFLFAWPLLLLLERF